MRGTGNLRTILQVLLPGSLLPYAQAAGSTR